MARKQDLIDAAAAAGIEVPDDATIADIEQLLAAAAAAATFDPSVRVEARYVGTQPRLVPNVGLIGYGDVFTVTAEQCRDAAYLIPADGDWSPDPDLLATNPNHTGEQEEA